ncbi:MAG TPA: hypothetical protein DHW72_14960, partial [Marinobacter hydrocarbonoclasticus]|nr:hypothetical protein [Marinobacter nauticus]
FRQQHPDVDLRRRSIELAVDQADGLPTMIGEKLTRMASEDSVEPAESEKQGNPEQTLYF